MSSVFQTWLGLPTLGLAVAVVLTVIGARLTAVAANLMLAAAWTLATISIYALPFLARVHFIPRILWTLLFASIAGLGLYQLRWSGPSIVASSKTTPQPAPPIALTLRFDPLVMFPFSVPPHTTSYAVLAHPKSRESWGSWEIRNAGAEPLLWPENNFEWAEPKKLGDMALALDLANHSSNDLVNVQIIFKFEFHEAIREGTTSRSGASTGTREHTVVIPIIAAKSSVRVYVGNQSSKHFAVVSFPTEAMALVAGESKRRTIRLIKTGVNIVEALPLFSLSPARVRWKGLGQPD